MLAVVAVVVAVAAAAAEAVEAAAAAGGVEYWFQVAETWPAILPSVAQKPATDTTSE